MSGTPPRAQLQTCRGGAKGPQEANQLIPTWLRLLTRLAPRAPIDDYSITAVRERRRARTAAPEDLEVHPSSRAPDLPISRRVRGSDEYCSPGEFLNGVPTYWKEHQDHFTDYLEEYHKARAERQKTPEPLPQQSIEQSSDTEDEKPATPKQERATKPQEIVKLRTRRSRKIKKPKKFGEKRSPTDSPNESPGGRPEDPEATRLRLGRTKDQPGEPEREPSGQRQTEATDSGWASAS